MGRVWWFTMVFPPSFHSCFALCAARWCFFKRGLSALSGGLIPPPTGQPDEDRLNAASKLLQALRKISQEPSSGSSSSSLQAGIRLSSVQSQALVQISRQVLAIYMERRAINLSRSLFRNIEEAIRAANTPPPKRTRS